MDTARVSSATQMRNALADSANRKTITEEKGKTFDHVSAVNQTIKFLEGIKLDPFVKSVMKARIIAPLQTGRARSHLSIAIELGARVDDVIAAEAYGVQAVESLLASTHVQDMIDKYNRDKTITDAVKQFGNSGVQLTQNPTKEENHG